MPGSMDGLRLAAAIRDRWPPILSHRPCASETQPIASGSLFVPKPYAQRNPFSNSTLSIAGNGRLVERYFLKQRLDEEELVRAPFATVGLGAPTIL